MSQYTVLKRYSLIIQKVQDCYYPKRTEIIDYLARKGLEISERTLQRDFKQLENEFGLRISYSRSMKGYFMSEEDKIQLEPFMNFLEILDTFEIISTSLSESREALKFISFDSGENTKGGEFLKPFLLALREQRIVKFDYRSFDRDEKKEFEVLPYLLKQYMGRWYLVACFKNRNRLYLFGLDRMLSVVVSTVKFKPDPKINPKQKFNQVIGISDNKEAPRKILLSFKPDVVPYLKSMPLHSSQRIQFETNKECRVELYVKINNELISKILSFGPSVRVIEPEMLVCKIRNLIADAISLYNS